MENITDITLRAYDEHAEEWAESKLNNDFWSEDRTWLLQQIQPGTRIVEFGPGAGIEAARFIRAGLDYTGIDGSSGMIALAGQRVPPETLRLMNLREAHLLDGEPPFGSFWCAAVLLHIPKNEIRNVLHRIRAMLCEEAPGFISVKNGTGEEWDNRLSLPRFFSYWEEEEFADVLTACGFSLEGKRSLQDGRTGKPYWHCYRVKCVKII